MGLIIVTERAADADIDEQFAYFAERNFDAGLRFYDAVGRTLQQLADMPGLGTKQDLQSRQLTEIRRFAVAGFPNYLIFYRSTESELRIVRVLHGARDVTSVLKDP